MDKIQKIREIIEGKLDTFSDGEYLELMNLLMGLSTMVAPSEPAAQEWQPSGSFTEEELDALFQEPILEPIMGQRAYRYVSLSLEWLNNQIRNARTTQEQVRAYFCYLSYAFQHYNYIQANPVIKLAIIQRADRILTVYGRQFDGKLEYIKYWLDYARRN